MAKYVLREKSSIFNVCRPQRVRQKELEKISSVRNYLTLQYVSL